MQQKNRKLILNLTDLISLCSQYKKDNKKIIMTNGCFDILHVGHAHILKESRKMGDVLIVALNSDKSINSIKGDNRPIMKQDERAWLQCSHKNWFRSTNNCGLKLRACQCVGWHHAQLDLNRLPRHGAHSFAADCDVQEVDIRKHFRFRHRGLFGEAAAQFGKGRRDGFLLFDFAGVPN